MGFDQRWELFAPNTRVVNCHTVVVVTMKNGNSTIWPLPRMDVVDQTQKYVRDKFRKWGTDNLPWEDHREFWPDFARWVGRSHYERDNPPVTAIFVVYEAKIPSVETAFAAQDKQQVYDSWRTAFCYKYKPEDFR